MSWYEINYWNKHSYGNAIRVKKRWVKAGLIFICLVTPATNWIIPFIGKLIKSDIVWRYN